MLTVEEAFDLTLIEEGQFLLGEDFITETLGFTMDKISKVFYKSIKEYSRRKPIQETTVISGGTNGNFLMPVGTLAVRAIRYDILDDYPRTMFPDFGQRNYEFDRHTRRLRTFPPMSSLRVSYDREYSLTDSATLETSEYSVSYEESITLRLSATPKKGTLKVTRNGKSMEEKGVQDVDTLDENGNRIKSQRIILKGELGEGYYDRKTRMVEVFFNTEEDGDVVATFTPSYLVCPELDTGEYVYMMLFKSYILEAIASLRSQSTQLELHNIDLTNDDLYGRVRILKALVDQKLRNTIDFGAMSPI